MEEIKILMENLHLSKEASNLLMTAINKPQEMEQEQLEKLANILLAKGTSAVKLDRSAARLCSEVCRAETLRNEDKLFRSFLLTNLQSKYKKHVASNYVDEESWLHLVGFLCAIFDLLRVNNMPLMALINPVISALLTLAEPKYAKNEKAIQCLVRQLQFIGEDLDRLNKKKIDQLFEKLDVCFLSSESTQLSRLFMLEIIELRCGGWKLSQSAFDYYYKN